MLLIKKNILQVVMLIATIAIFTTPVRAQTTLDQGSDAWRLSVAYHPRFVRTEVAYESKPFWETRFLNKRFDVRVDGSLAYWRATHTITMTHSHRSMWQVGVTPMMRWWLGERWFAEAGIGATLMSHTRFSNKEFSTAFQFGDHIGLGWALNNQWRLGLRYSHFSNASIKKPNPGFDMLSLSLSRTF